MIDIRNHGGRYSEGGGLKSDPSKELLVSATPYGREIYTSSTDNYIFAVNDKYVAYRRNHINPYEIMIIDRATQAVVLYYKINGSYMPFIRSFQLTGAINGDWLYFTVEYSSSYSLYALNIKTATLKEITGSSSAGRFESVKLCSDGFVYAVSYNRLMKLDNAGNVIYLVTFNASAGGNRIFGIFNGDLIIGLNTNGIVCRFNPSTGSLISAKVVGGSNNAPSHFIQAGGKYFVITGTRLDRWNYDFTLNDIVLTDVLSAYGLDEDTILAFRRDNGTYPAGASTYNPGFITKKQSVTGFNITSDICNEKANNYFEVVQGYGGTSEPTVENSVVRVYYK